MFHLYPSLLLMSKLIEMKLKNTFYNSRGNAEQILESFFSIMMDSKREIETIFNGDFK